jgi:hypothetical protein
MFFPEALFVIGAMLLLGGKFFLVAMFVLEAMLILGGEGLSDLVCHKSAQTFVTAVEVMFSFEAMLVLEAMSFLEASSSWRRCSLLETMF